MTLAAALIASVMLPALQQGPDKTITREWIYYPNDNGIETITGGVHVWHASDFETDAHSYAVLRLDLPVSTANWDIQFRVRFGVVGTVPSRVELRVGGTRFLEVNADKASGQIKAVLGTKTVYTAPVDDAWRAFKITGSETGLALSLYGKQIAVDPTKGAPDILVFGGMKGAVGRQTEAWLKLDSVHYKVPTAVPGKNPPGAGVRPFSADLASLRQVDSAAMPEFGPDKGWRWMARLKVRNDGPADLDVADLGTIRLLTDDYRENVLGPVRLDPVQGTYVPIGSGEKTVPKGGTLEVVYVSSSVAPLPSGKPVRVELRSSSGTQNLPLPPP